MRARVAIPMRRWVLAGLLVLLALPLLMPLRLAIVWFGLGEAGLTARAAEGSVWNGKLVEARLGPVALGDLDARLNFFPLFVGRARIDLAQGETRGAVSASLAGRGIDDVTALIPAAGAFAPLPITAIDMADVSVAFRDGLCASAEGRVRADLGGGATALGLPGSLAGNARCDAGALLLPLVSASGAERLTLRIDSARTWQAVLTIAPADAATRDRMAAAGFTTSSGGLQLKTGGRL